MKGTSITLGIFILAGLVAGAFIIAFAGTGSQQELKTELESAGIKIENLTAKVGLLEQRISGLNIKLDNNMASIDENNRKINEFDKKFTATAEKAEKTIPANPHVAGGKDSTRSLPEAIAGRPETLETLKEELKKELKEERKIEEVEKRVKWVGQMKESETKKWQKKLDEEFPKLAEKIGLSPTQEYAIKDIAEAAFKEIMALWEDAMGKPESEVDWTAFGENMEKIYKDAEAQVTELVNEEQGKALGKFFED